MGLKMARKPRVGASDRDVMVWILAELSRQDDYMQELSNKLKELPRAWRSDIDQARSESERLAHKLVAGLADRNLALRLLGVGYVVVGLLLSAAGNLV